MIELFCREDFELKKMTGVTPIHIDESVSSLSAILLDDNYYKALLQGKEAISGITVLRPEYLILFKAKAYLDMKNKKELGGRIDSSDIKKHKKDILRISAELLLEVVEELPDTVNEDIHIFINSLYDEPFDTNSLKKYGVKNEDVIDLLNRIYG